MELTDKIHILTRYFLDNNIDIYTLNLIMIEIRRKSVAQIVDEYCNTSEAKRKLGVKHINDAARYSIQLNIQSKINKLKDKPWFNIEEYDPDNTDIENVKKFYESLIGTEKMTEHIKKKGSAVPSFVDMALLCYSNDNSAHIITNDTDITRFKPELKRDMICFEVLKLSEVSF
ncbi:hypothetical protein [Methanobacterium sp. SMA-27]|uniref:hypothetical protein n=1 Tax=Methanobacterium sp. SMA-27 TaxID=1495336 RepID=UPI00064EF731|nr:hypothetical protein [Methanobacterium sp. SMA-27]